MNSNLSTCSYFRFGNAINKGGRNSDYVPACSVRRASPTLLFQREGEPLPTGAFPAAATTAWKGRLTTRLLLPPTHREHGQDRRGLPDPVSHAPVKDVVIFPTPAPVLVREAIDLQKLCLAQARDTSKVARVWQPARDKQERWEISQA